MSSGCLNGITWKSFTDKCYGHPLSILFITPYAVTIAASASSHVEFYKSLNYFSHILQEKKKKKSNKTEIFSISISHGNVQFWMDFSKL